jgi:hypothetical protein
LRGATCGKSAYFMPHLTHRYKRYLLRCSLKKRSRCIARTELLFLLTPRMRLLLLS